MKTYVANYLPADEEVNEGDSVFFDDPYKKTSGFKDWSGYAKVTVINAQHYMIDLVHTTTDVDLKDLKKVKLFLCSKDIKIGDKVYQIDKNHYGEYTGMIENWNTYKIGEGKENLLSSPKDKLIKVIGEISTEAIWIKHMDEIDEEEVYFHYNHRKFRDKDFTSS